jgi:small nuclear ribonucleoprotein (snRNP)-like protein
MATKKKTGKAVIVTTERRGVFYGRLRSYDESTRVAVLDDAIMPKFEA